MNTDKKIAWVKNVKRKKFAKGGSVPKRQKFGLGGGISTAGAGAAAGAAVAGPVGGVIGAIGGFLAGLFGGGPKPPNITDPITGQQITDASGNVVATQQALNNYASTLRGMNGPENQQAVIQALDKVYQGTGPNPAKAMLAEATGANVANQQALAAGQRGAAGNVGLIARQAAQQGAATEQQAVGQNAVLEAQQQLGALGQMGTVAGQQVEATQNALNAAGTQAINNQGQVLTGETAFNQQQVAAQGNVNTTEASYNTAAIPLIQGAASGVGTALAAGATPTSAPSGGVQQLDYSGKSGMPSAQIGGFKLPFAEGGKVVEGPHKSHVANFIMMAKGGMAEKKVPAMVSPGEIYLSPEHVKAVQHGANPLRLGRKIPGKAKVKGDSLKNDTVPATLEEGGVVLPRHIVNKMSPDKAKLFVLKSLAKKQVKNG